MTPTEHVIAWAQAIEEEDYKKAIEHHDIVSAYILENKHAQPPVSASIFVQGAPPAQAFVAWKEIKNTLKAQLSKSPEELRGDFDKGREQLGDLTEKLLDAKTTRDVLALTSEFHTALKSVTLNASCLDDERKAAAEKEEAEKEKAKVEFDEKEKELASRKKAATAKAKKKSADRRKAAAKKKADAKKAEEEAASDDDES